MPNYTNQDKNDLSILLSSLQIDQISDLKGKSEACFVLVGVDNCTGVLWTIAPVNESTFKDHVYYDKKSFATLAYRFYSPQIKLYILLIRPHVTAAILTTYCSFIMVRFRLKNDLHLNTTKFFFAVSYQEYSIYVK